MPIADLNTRDRFLIVGSFLRKDHPLLAQRIRQAVKTGAQANIVHSSGDDLLMPVANQTTVAPSQLVNVLAQILKAVAAEKSVAVEVGDVEISASAQAIASSLISGERGAVLLGNFAQQHPQAAQLATLAQQIAVLTGATFGYLGEAANSVGGYIANAVPSEQGLNAAQMLASPRKVYVLLNVEPELDMYNPQQAMAAMQAADMVVALSAYKHQAIDYADVLLPIAPFTETSGTFINTEGRVQSFKGAVKPLGEARPAWKVLRVLGNLLDVDGFDYTTSEAVRDEVLAGGNVADKLNNQLTGIAMQAVASTQGLERISEVLIYAADAVVRRAVALHKTPDAATPCASLHSETLQQLGIAAGERVKVSQGTGSALLTAVADDSLPLQTVRVAAGHAATAQLGAMFGVINVERA
jgi:NADH-quinone oxidoreductase subunit G